MILWQKLQQQLEPSGNLSEFSIMQPGSEEHAMKSVAAILNNFYNAEQ
jgi:hypothetical protein